MPQISEKNSMHNDFLEYPKSFFTFNIAKFLIKLFENKLCFFVVVNLSFSIQTNLVKNSISGIINSSIICRPIQIFCYTKIYL